MNIIGAIFGFFGAVFKAGVKYWYITLAIFVFCVGYWLWHGWNEAEKKAENSVAADNQIRVDEAKTNANQAANIASQAVTNVKTAENANFYNTNLTEANRLRCQAFPERCR